MATWQDTKRQAAAMGFDDPVLAERADRLLEDYLHSERLADIRKRLGRSQTELAAAMGVNQGRVSQIENSDLSNTKLSTVESYVEALGGRVRIVVDFDDFESRIA